MISGYSRIPPPIKGSRPSTAFCDKDLLVPDGRCKWRKHIRLTDREQSSVSFLLGAVTVLIETLFSRSSSSGGWSPRKDSVAEGRHRRGPRGTLTKGVIVDAQSKTQEALPQGATRPGHKGRRPDQEGPPPGEALQGGVREYEQAGSRRGSGEAGSLLTLSRARSPLRWSRTSPRWSSNPPKWIYTMIERGATREQVLERAYERLERSPTKSNLQLVQALLDEFGRDSRRRIRTRPLVTQARVSELIGKGG